MTNIPWKGQCERCGEYLLMPFRCNYCGKTFCIDHYHPEDHNCPNFQRDVWVPVHTDISRPSDKEENQRSVEPVVKPPKKKIVAGIVGVVIISIILVAIILNPTTPEQSANIEWELELLTSELGYDAETAKFVAQEVNSWTDFFGAPFLGGLKEELTDAKGKYDDEKLAKAEIKVTKKLGKKIKKEIPDYETNNWELENVLRYKEANCLGYTQLFFILGEVIGLQVEPVEVVEFVETYTSEDFDRFFESDDNVLESHALCLVDVSNEEVVFVELSASSPVFSEALILEEKYVENGTYREAKYRNDRDIFGYLRIRLFGKEGLVSSILAARAYNYANIGKYEMAISNLNEAIKIDPKNALAYNNRGCIQKTLGEYESAISDFSKSIEIDPKNAAGYYNRGHVYILLFEYQTAITDFTKAIESDQKLSVAYYSRGLCYNILGEYEKAIDDLDQVIYSLSCPRTLKGKAYYARGLAHLAMGEDEMAERDFEWAQRYDPSLSLDGGASIFNTTVSNTYPENDWNSQAAVEILNDTALL